MYAAPTATASGVAWKKTFFGLWTDCGNQPPTLLVLEAREVENKASKRGPLFFNKNNRTKDNNMEQLYSSCGATARSRRGQTLAVSEAAADVSGKPIWMECGLRGDISSDSENESDNQTWMQISPIDETKIDTGKEVTNDANKDLPTGKLIPLVAVEATGAAVRATTVRHYEVTTDRRLKVKSIKRRKSEVSAADIAQAQKAHESQRQR